MMDKIATVNSGQFKPGEIRRYERTCIKCSQPFLGTAPQRQCDACRPRSLTEKTFIHESKVRCPQCCRVRIIRGGVGRDYPPGLDGMRERRCLECLMGRPLRRASKETRLRVRDKAWMERAYAEHSSIEIAKSLGVDPQLVCVWLRKHEIPIRSLSEAMRRYQATRADRSKGRNRQMVTAGVSDVRVRITEKGWKGG